MLLRILVQSLILIQILRSHLVNGHGFIYDPVGRASAWRKNFKTPTDFDDDGEYFFGRCLKIYQFIQMSSLKWMVNRIFLKSIHRSILWRFQFALGNEQWKMWYLW